MEIPSDIPELAGALTPTFILFTVAVLLPIAIRHILIIALALRKAQGKRLGSMYLTVCLTDILAVVLIIAVWIFRELVIALSFV